MQSKSLEIRINSLQDAKSVMQNFIAINEEVSRRGLSSIECLVAQEIQKEAQTILTGAFKVKAFYSAVKPRDGNSLYIIPPFRENLVIPIKRK